MIEALVLAVRLDQVLDASMRSTTLKLLMGIMLFCSLESAVDASSVVNHHHDSAGHGIHHHPDSDHDDEDCQHLCHCTAHLPSITVVNDGLGWLGISACPSQAINQRYTSHAVAPPLRPPIS